jgi:hypothetical protein
MNRMGNDIAVTDHPSWCSRPECQVADPGGGAHRSRPVPVRCGRTDLAITVQVLQFEPVDGFPDSGRPFVNLTAGLPDYGPDHPAEEYLLCFGGEEAQTVGRVLLTAGRQASSARVGAPGT